MQTSSLTRLRSMSVMNLFNFVRHSSSAPTGKTIGFVGLGNMGSNMATNLIKKGNKLIVYDIQSANAQGLEKIGAKLAKTPAEMAEESEFIVTMLPAPNHVKSVYNGQDGILKGVKPGTILIDSSTIDPDTSKEMSALASEKKAIFLDAPVSGGVPAAKSGTLCFMVGGGAKECKIIEPILLAMGAKVVHCGDVGMGQAAKICNNMLLAIEMIGVSETFLLGMKMGLDPKTLNGIINSSSGRCWSSEIYNPVPGLMENVPSANNYQGGFLTALMTKDLGLAQSAATSTLTATPMGNLACSLYRIMCNKKEYVNKDFSSVFQFLKGKDIP